jgi:signal recognition particle receptor subunit beta
MGGANNYRPLWQQWANEVDGIIFVVDSSDIVRFSTAADELESVLTLPTIASSLAPLLVFANKNDIEGSAPADVINRELRIDQIQNRATLVESVCCQFPSRLKSALTWLVQRVGKA